MAQYKHDRFFKFYLRSFYQSKGETLQNIQVRNDEDLEIDFMFMKTMAEIDAWYDAEMDKAESKGKTKGKLEGKLESATRVIGVKFQGYVPTENVTSQLAALNEQQLDDLIVGMFSWQTVAQMEEWLNLVDSWQLIVDS